MSNKRKPVEVHFEQQAPQITMPAAPKPRQPEHEGEGPWVELITGQRFYFTKPVWDIGAIAHSLSLQCRFTGQCNKFYSVAEHSILVSRIMADLGLGDPMEGLLHDGTESVLSDINGPAKMILNEYRELESALDISLRRAFDLPEEKTDGCRKADRLALLLEARELMPSKGANWDEFSDGLRAQANALTYQINAWTSDNAKQRFMMRMSDIRRQLRGLR